MSERYKRVIVKWTGAYPCLCSGEWNLKIDGKDYSKFIPFTNEIRSEPANTYGIYSRWSFGGESGWEEDWEDYEDGLEEAEWIKENEKWLNKITKNKNLKQEIFKAFQQEDWRYSSCGGCI